jgi:hypothetical protein
MLAADRWYASSSVIGNMQVALAILTIVATVWVGLYAIRPRQLLIYRLLSSRRLTDSEDASLSEAKRGHGFASIKEIRLRGRGRRDIPSSSFDSGMPITLYLVCGEIHCLIGEPVSIPEERPPPKAEVVDGALAIGPGLIGRNQIITYKVLACQMGSPSEPLAVRSSLIDVRMQSRRTFGCGAAAIVSVVIESSIVWIFFASPVSAVRQIALLLGSFLGLVAVLGIMAIVVLVVHKIIVVVRHRFM